MTTEQVLHKIYREESGKIISVLTKIFGATNLNLSEDVMQEAYIEALEKWGNRIPKNPTAWIYSVARNKALNIVNQNKYKEEHQNEVAHLSTSDWTADTLLDMLFSEEEMKDDQLKMMFICCIPEIFPEAQTTLILKTLCGFGIPEIAKAFLIAPDTINKRLVRAREILKNVNALFTWPEEDEINQKVSNVLQTIYLLFNEGYSASQGDSIIRYELCLESIRLVQLILDSDQVKSKSEANALMALMKLNAARFISRLSEDNEAITLKNQDRSKWNQSLIGSGIQNLNKSMYENQVSKYLIMAAISANHCAAKTYAETQWDQILNLYDQLVRIEDSPIVQLNRSVAKSMVKKIRK
jgi:RNA polymerase sigma-70 factor (ECF subfamily)|tara:strand:- start:18274 stop:19335 length:1062 start_codon:yes stop_codon:yes gene_type:complete